jgi:hypothetical protein
MPIPGEIRTVNGKTQMWMPWVSHVSPPMRHAIPTKKTLSVYRQNFSAGADRLSILNVIGAGELREIVVIADQKINVIVTVDGQDILYGKNDFDNVSTTSVHSKYIEARYDDPDYIVGFNGIHFQHSLDITLWFDNPAVISSIVGIYDSYGEE